MAGSLTVVGTGFAFPAQATQEALDAMRGADIVYYNVGPPNIVVDWIKENAKDSFDLYTFYEDGKDRRDSYREMADAVIGSVEEGKRVVAAYYGHPGVFVDPSFDAIRECRKRGYRAVMQPGVAAFDCMIADLEFDPAVHGCAMVEASQYVVQYNEFSVDIPLVIWQAGVTGDLVFRKSGRSESMDILHTVLKRRYPGEHKVICYMASSLSGFGPQVDVTTVDTLREVDIHASHTLLVPPVGFAAMDEEIREELRRRSGYSADGTQEKAPAAK